MIENDLLGQDRYSRHRWWGTSDRIVGGEPENAGDATLQVEFHVDRWLLTKRDVALHDRRAASLIMRDLQKVVFDAEA